MASLADLVPDVLSGAKGAPKFIAQKELLRIANELFVDTEIWEETTDSLLLKGLNSTNVDLPGGADVVRYQWFIVDRERLTPVTESEYYEREDGSKGRPVLFAGIGPDVFVHPIPDKQYNYKARYSVYPTALDTDLPDRVFNKVRHALTDGATANITLTPGQWYDPEVGSYFKQEYERKKAMLQRNADRDVTKPVHVTTYGGI